MGTETASEQKPSEKEQGRFNLLARNGISNALICSFIREQNKVSPWTCPRHKNSSPGLVGAPAKQASLPRFRFLSVSVSVSERLPTPSSHKAHFKELVLGITFSLAQHIPHVPYQDGGLPYEEMFLIFFHSIL